MTAKYKYNPPFSDPAEHAAKPKPADPRIAFSGECMILERHDSRAGRTAKFMLDPDLDSHPFADFDKETRFFAVFVHIDESEMPVAETETARTERKFERVRARGGRHSKFVGILCRDRMFQIYLVRLGWLQKHWRPQSRREMAAQYVVDQCGISSRAELDTEEGAFDRFRERVEIPFFKWLQQQKK